MTPKKYAAIIILIALFAVMGLCVLFAEPTPTAGGSTVTRIPRWVFEARERGFSEIEKAFATPSPAPELTPPPADSPTFPLVLAFAGTSSDTLVSPTPAASPTPAPASTPVPSPPAFTPDPDVVNFIVKGNPFTNPQWLFPQTTDPTEQPGASRFSTFLISTFEPHITKDGATWRITFEP